MPRPTAGVLGAVLKPAGLVAAVFVVLALRRPDQLAHPYVWCEDGTVTLPQYLAVGWRSVFLPVAGYLILPAKLIFLSATKLSFLHQPAFAYWLTFLFTCGVTASIAFSPTTLRWPALCAIATLLVPTDSEVFAVPLYTLWWGTLLAIVPLLWRDNARPHVVARPMMVLVGGLSSPLVIALVPLYVARWVRSRARADAVVLGASAVAAFVEAAVLLRSGPSPSAPTGVESLPLIIPKFFGYFLHASTDLRPSAVAGVLLLAFVGGSAVRHRRSWTFQDGLLVASLGVAIVASVSRVPVAAIHPVLAGPRYFFFAFVLLSWMLVQIAAVGRAGTRVAVALVFAFSVEQTVAYGRQVHFPYDWTREVLACTQSATHSFPIHYTGVRDEAWTVDLSGAACRRLVAESLLDGHLEGAIVTQRPGAQGRAPDDRAAAPP